jgi:multidrug efflux pump subunit AcrB
MTITLAAVYAPLGIQGGLTGSLFREFAFRSPARWSCRASSP